MVRHVRNPLILGFARNTGNLITQRLICPAILHHGNRSVVTVSPSSGGFRPELGGGHSPPPVLLQPPSFVATHDFFAKITQMSNVFVFPKFRKGGKFVDVQNPNRFSFRGGASPP